MIYFDYYITRLVTIGQEERGQSTVLFQYYTTPSPCLLRVSNYKKDDNKLLLSMSKELVLQQQTLQTEREPEIETEIETEIECPRYYDIMTLSYDFDKLYYFCEECNLSLLIN
jgi:hypothetical protein